MIQPTGFEDKEKLGYACKLHKALYELTSSKELV